MAKVVKKKKKIRSALAGGGGAAQARQTSPLRPRFVPKKPPCRENCPSGTDVRTVVTMLAQARKKQRPWEQAVEEAFGLITEKNPFPSTCGRVCPHPCESACNRQELDQAVAVNSLERYIGDFGLDRGLKLKLIDLEPKEENIAVLGSGPAGLSCAYQLARRGYPVTVFEAFSKPGGMLRYGIPPYRLPREVLDREIGRILDLGVELRTDTSVGNDVPLAKIKESYKAVFVGIGAHSGLHLNVPGEDAGNVYTGAQFLHRINSAEPVDIGKKVIVIGGGDSAIDAARVSRRFGAETVLVYRRTLKQMPAIEHEIEEAVLEGVKLEFLAAPVEILVGGDKTARGIRCVRMELKEADGSGRPRPVPIAGSQFDIDADTIISAISQEPDFSGLEELKAGPKDWVKVDNKTQKTGLEGVFAGGDVTDLGLVTIAIAQGRFAANAIDDYIRGTAGPENESGPTLVITPEKMKLEHYEKKPRQTLSVMPVEQRLESLDTEVTSTFTEQQAMQEVDRCLSCGYCMECEKCWMYCQVNAVLKADDPQAPFGFKLELCDGCRKCAEECPCGYIEMF